MWLYAVGGRIMHSQYILNPHRLALVTEVTSSDMACAQ